MVTVSLAYTLVDLISLSPIPPHILLLVVFVLPFSLYLIKLTLDDAKPRSVFANVPHKKSVAPLPEQLIKRPWKCNLPESADAIVIGSGASGLMTAVILAKSGKKVVVLEQHDRAGGALHTFEEHGAEFASGVHYIGAEMCRAHSLGRVMSDTLTDGAVDWSMCGETYDVALVGDKRVELKAGRDNYVAAFEKTFPGSTPAVNRYLDMCKEARAAAIDLAIDKMLAGATGLTWLKLSLLRLFKRSKFPKWNRPLQELLDEVTDDKELQAALVYPLGDYGEPPSKASAFIQTTLTNHYLNGSSYPVRGPSELAKAAVANLERLGGRVLVRCSVKEILTEGDVVTGVSIEDGPVLRAPIVVSTVGMANTFKSLLPQSLIARHGYDAMLSRVSHSRASQHLSLFVVLEGDQAELNLPQYNLWIYPSSDHDGCLNKMLKADPAGPDGLAMMFISFPSAKDPEYNTRYPGKSAVEVLSLAPFDLYQPFEGERVKSRGNQYKKMKEAVSAKLLERLYAHFPQVRGKVSYHELGTPITTKHYLRSPNGASYGLAHDCARFSEDLIRPTTPISGLYLSGQDTYCVGVVPVLLSGVLTGMAITGSDYMSEIMAEGRRRRKVVEAAGGGKKKSKMA